MAITALPDVDYVAPRKFDLRRTVLATPFRGGGAQVIETGPSRWMASFTTQTLDLIAFGRFQAWLDDRRGGLEPFLGHDPHRPLPGEYIDSGLPALTSAGNPFAGTGAVTQLTATTIRLVGLPANFQFRAGDYVGLVEEERRGLFRVAADLTGASNGIATVNIQPNVPLNLFSTAATYKLTKAACLMLIDPTSIAEETIGRRASISFDAIQRVA
ncbi:hypothetical protein FHS85_001747 [Rhodoligotrophos appendicifer]|uniref:hypothetical protein n=1 Tax=Rhodoligotrophos appendicifer TaxID=987056 RepID=UPI0011848BCF|nr:hypothetical protein [Rhodoligotrophos appendicifer]